MRSCRCIILVLLGAAALCSLAYADPGQHYTLITILHTNDIHGHVINSDGGLARVATLVRQIRADMPNVLLLDGGDIIQGEVEDYLSNGQATISAMNAMGYQAAVTGNHEYDFGLDTLKAAMAAAKFPFLAANVHAAAGGQWDKVQPYVVFNMDGVRVGVFGLTTLESVTLNWPDSLKDIVVEDPIATARSVVPQVRAVSDVVVALTHLGINEDRVLAKEVPGIDFIVGAHSHSLIVDWLWEGDTLITQAGCYAQALGRIDFIVRTDEKGVFDRFGKRQNH